MPFQATLYRNSDFANQQAGPITLYVSARSMDVPLLKSFPISLTLYSVSVTLLSMRFDVTEFHYFIFDII
jgi:hypothetical protein